MCREWKWQDCPLRLKCKSYKDGACEVIVNRSLFERFERWWHKEMKECFHSKEAA